MADPPRLDMAHGFVKCILKNQIDRDGFERYERVRAVQENQERRERKRKSQAMYVPPHLRGVPAKTEACEGQDGSSTSEKSEVSSLDVSSRIILQLFLEMKTGNTRKLEVHEGEDVKETVRNFALENGLDDRLKNALLHKVRQALGPRSS